MRIPLFNNSDWLWIAFFGLFTNLSFINNGFFQIKYNYVCHVLLKFFKIAIDFAVLNALEVGVD
ncbi:hypothetical protein BpHYR1_047070 [Brachionus plicatilis]|uniref:Uncharacterized protein n=1 Tax=Brachionus plicatilis TaxID=10195 RepID=A0A3M7QWD6_BRAPC|nr:hypothetical protein BpHYR1_047070 [Brachionus plicatilis]